MPRTIPLEFEVVEPEEMVERSRAFLARIRRRRSVRVFSDRDVLREVLLNCIEAASSAPSGANTQPWTFVLVPDPEIKAKIRAAAEKEEQAFYSGRAPQRWLDDLAPLGTDATKEFLDIAPALIVVFAQKHGREADERHYYVNESVGIAVGFLLAALHEVGLATLTHTPSPMAFLRDVLDRPSNERAYVLIPVGYAADGCRVPDIARKPLSEVLVVKD